MSAPTSAGLRPNAPLVTGISPHQGPPGTQITIRGQNLGEDPNDLIALVICGTDCLAAAKWKSSSKIIARLGGQAKRGPGDVLIVTRSGGRGHSEVQFRVFVEQLGPLQESTVWVDESKTVPGRNLMRNVAESGGGEQEDALGLGIDPQKKLDHAILLKMFPDASGSRKMENFSPAWYLLENYKSASIDELRRGLRNLEERIEREDQCSKQLHKANLFPLISCVDALAKLQSRIHQKAQQADDWPISAKLAEKIDLAKQTADQLFRDVLSRKDYADSTRNALSVLTRFRFIFFLAEQIEDNMAKSEYATILNDYARAKALFKDTEVSLFKEVMSVLDEKVDRLRGVIRQRLMDISTPFEEQSRLIKYLKILDPESDPAWDCMMSYHGWLESMLWELQKQYYTKAVEEEQRRRRASLALPTAEGGEQLFLEAAPPSSSFDFDAPKPAHYFRQAFVVDLLGLMTDKLQTFWKISQNFAVTGGGGGGTGALAMAAIANTSLSEATEIQERQMDIDQMLTNTINVGSWLLLNALVPAALPETVTKQYKDQFVLWPSIGGSATDQHWAVMFPAIKTLRSSIRTLVDCQLNRNHLQPLTELCTTIRLKCLGMLVERGKEAILALASHENWRVDLVADPPRTELPDLYETEINELLPDLKCILLTGNFSGETDLFTREKWRQMIIDLFTVLLLAIRDCYDHLLKLRREHNRRPNTLSDSASLGSADEDGRKAAKQPQHEQTSRKFLTAIANIDFVLGHSLAGICRRFSDNGLKYADQVFKRTKDKLSTYRQSLLSHYTAQKAGQVRSIMGSANYEHLPDEDDVSDFVKELMLCAVFVQSEMAPLCAQFTQQVLADIVKVALERLFASLASRVDLLSSSKCSTTATQIIVDLSAFEEAFNGLVTGDMSGALSSIRARLMGRLDNDIFRSALLNFRARMRMAIESLQEHSNESSNNSGEDTGTSGQRQKSKRSPESGAADWE